MTASELISELQKLPPDVKVVIRGYEDGYNNILELKPVRIKQTPDSHWYVGEYDDSTDEDAVEAVDLFGKNTIAKD
ncbi:MAG: hypothetical protein ABIN97_16045 [Ginsengibacter sp.]